MLTDATRAQRACLVACVACAILLAGCDSGYEVFVRNDSSDPLVVEVRGSYRPLTDVAPGTQYLVDHQFGASPPQGLEVRVFRADDCALLGAVQPVDSTSLVVVDSHGQVTLERVDGVLGVTGAPTSYHACSPDLRDYVATPTPTARAPSGR